MTPARGRDVPLGDVPPDGGVPPGRFPPRRELAPERLYLVCFLCLFLTSAILGSLFSYNTGGALARLAVIVAGMGVGVLFWWLPEGKGRRSWLGFVLAVLPALIFLYYVLTTEWESRLGKLPLLDPILLWLAGWTVAAPGVILNSNSLGGLLAALLPLQIGAVFLRKRKLTWTGTVLLAISVLGLLVSESRGAWFALAGVLGLAALHKASDRIARRWTRMQPHQVQMAIVAGVVALVLSAGTAAIFTPAGRGVLERRYDRLQVWQNSLDLAGDYAFTGIGLNGFEMAYSSYVLLLHVGHTIHAHNLFLDVWLEQGLMGLVAFMGMIALFGGQLIARIWRGERAPFWPGMALASLGIVMLHGMMDDPFYGYGGYGILFLFVPFGILARSLRVTGSQKELSFTRLLPIISGLMVAVVMISLVPVFRSAFVANLGTLAQTRAELSVYRWPDWPVQDEVRRSDKIDLAPAITYYQAALGIDPRDVVANRRLGQIEISRGAYASAQKHLEAAFAAAPGQRATRQLLGELYAIGGSVDRAAALWETIDVNDGQLENRQWWYEHIGEQENALRMKQAMDARREVN